MHGYWAALFPTDYEVFDFEDKWVKTYRTEIDFTMGITDQLFTRPKNFVARSSGYEIWITTSMGPEATVAETFEKQVDLTDVDKFFDALMG